MFSKSKLLEMLPYEIKKIDIRKFSAIPFVTYTDNKELDAELARRYIISNDIEVHVVVHLDKLKSPDVKIWIELQPSL